MISYTARRLLTAIPTLLFISLVLFALLEAAPGDPLTDLPLTIPPDVREKIRLSLGLGEPWHVRYLLWLDSFFVTEPLHLLDRTFSTGFAQDRPRILSYQTRSPVFMTIAERLPQTLQVVGGGLLLGIALALPVGIVSACRPHSCFDRLGTLIALVGISVPVFVTGALLTLVFSVWVPRDSWLWLPTIYDTGLAMTDGASLVAQLRQMILPVAVLALFYLGQISRYLRAAMRDALAQDYVRTARAKGLAERDVVFGHALRNAMLPVVTVIALLVPGVFTGAILTETIFGINGLGQQLLLSLQGKDTPMVITITFIFAVLVVMFNLLADILYGVLDPRIRYD